MIQQQPNKKRVLTKIRRQTITRCQEDSETPNIVITDPKPQTSDKIFLINPCFGLVENDRKVCMGTQYLNLFFNIASLSIDNHAGVKAVTLNLNLNENNNSYTHWESTVERLESYGEAESTSWAYRIRKHYSNYPALMAKYFDLLHSNDPQVYASLRKAKVRAILACKEIENKYTYRKLLTYSTKDSTEILSISYSESLLGEIGHTVEGFAEWTRENGVPTLFNSECPSHLDLAKNFFECATLNGGPIQERSEYVTQLFNKDGSKQTVVAQYITITEPTHNGFFNSGYFILKRKFKGNDDMLCDKINLEADIQIDDDKEGPGHGEGKEKMVEDS